MSKEYEENMFHRLVEKTDPNVIVDVGSGQAEYVNDSARKNKDKTYVSLDLVYGRENLPRKGNDNVHFIKADGRYLPLKDDCSDLTTEFGCLPMCMMVEKDSYKILTEMRRVTKPTGIGANRTLETCGVMPKDKSSQRILKELANEGKRVGFHRDGGLILPPTDEVLKIRDNIKLLMDHRTDDIFSRYGLVIKEKVKSDYGNIVYLWKKGEPKTKDDVELFRTDYGVFGFMFKELEKLEPGL